MLEATAMGCTLLAGIGAGIYTGIEELEVKVPSDSNPVNCAIPDGRLALLIKRWEVAIKRSTGLP